MVLYFLPKRFHLQLDIDDCPQIIINKNEYITFIEDTKTSTFYVVHHDDAYITNNVFIQLDRPNNKNNVIDYFGCLNDNDILSSKQQLRFAQYVINGI